MQNLTKRQAMTQASVGQGKYLSAFTVKTFARKGESCKLCAAAVAKASAVTSSVRQWSVTVDAVCRGVARAVGGAHGTRFGGADWAVRGRGRQGAWFRTPRRSWWRALWVAGLVSGLRTPSLAG